MIMKFVGALFAPRYPRHYTGRHRASRSLRELTSGRPDWDDLIR